MTLEQRCNAIRHRAEDILPWLDFTDLRAVDTALGQIEALIYAARQEISDEWSGQRPKATSSLKLSDPVDLDDLLNLL